MTTHLDPDNIPDDIIEKIAVLHNGGTWPTRYKEYHRAHWRRVARKIIDLVANEGGCRMSSPHDILTAYSEGRILSSDAIERLHLCGFRDLLLAMADAGHPMPRPEITEGWWWVADSAGVATTIVRVVAPWPEAWDFLNEAGDPLAVLVAGEEVPQRIRCHTFLAKIERP